MGLCAISVDLDSLRHYLAIHGLERHSVDERLHALVHEVAIPRFLELFAELAVPCTLFAIGEELVEPGAQKAIALAAEQGHEIANHSWGHDYALTRRPADQIADEVQRAEERIAELTGKTPRGFRAPGYAISAELYAVLEARGYVYDASVLPAPPYFLAKAAVMGAMRVLGRSSGAMLDSPRVLLAPTEPYFPDRNEPYRRGRGSVLELPITVAPVSRVPFIGTLVTSAPRPLLAALYRTLRRTPVFNFELHAIDLLCADDGLPDALVRRQRDLRIPASVKRERLREVIGWMKADFEMVTVLEAAERANVAPAAQS